MAGGLAVALLAGGGFAEEKAAPAAVKPLPSPAEARVRAQLVHASIDGALRVMHRDFFRKGESKAIPSDSLRDVFKNLSADWGLSVRWLASDDTVQNKENRAVDGFGERALKAITGGEKEFSEVEGGQLRFAGVIVLQNQCLKCHVPNRKSLEERFAALEVSMPVQAAPAAAKP